MKAAKYVQNKGLQAALTATSVLLLFQNCGGFRSVLNYDEARLATLATTQVFHTNVNIEIIDGKCYETTPTGAKTEVPCPPTPTPTATPETPSPSPTATPENPSPTPTATPETPTPTPTPYTEEPPVTIPSPYFCARGITTVMGYSLRTAGENLKFAILPYKPFDDYAEGRITGPYAVPDTTPVTNVKPVCEWVEPELRNELLTRKSFTLKNLRARCPNLQPGTYNFAIVRNSQTTNYHRNLLTGDEPSGGLPLWSGDWQWTDSFRNLRRVDIKIENGSNGGLRASVSPYIKGYNYATMVILDTYGAPGCDYSVSPLIVQMNATSKLRLTSQDKGVMFDIFGLLAQPVAHTKVLISWLVPDTKQENYFITLPNQRGEVNGIEELFGDNTSGPDGKFAPNGYEALRKWDGRRANGTIDARARDGFITIADPVFTKLRFWKDENYDGLAQPLELHTPEELGVKSIDLNADPNFSEKDEYGNFINLKSVLETTDGALHVMYDLWFKPKH